jgi:hypothetical protein
VSALPPDECSVFAGLTVSSELAAITLEQRDTPGDQQMPRQSSFELVTDTSYFNPLQLQARALLATSFNSLARWLKEHFISFPKLIEQHKFSVVILGVNLAYEKPLGFFDGDSIRVEAAFRVLRGGSRAQLEVTFNGEQGVAARVKILFCPVMVEDTVSLAASPTVFGPELLARLQADEQDPGSPERIVPQIIKLVETSGELVGEGFHEFLVHRHLCEVADQWAFLEIPTLVEASRETLARRDGKKRRELVDGISKPLRNFDMELSRPYFWLQPGKVETKAYHWNGQLTLVHRLLSPVPGEPLHGIVVERF